MEILKQRILEDGIVLDGLVSAVEELETEAKTTMVVAVDGEAVGVVAAVAATAREADQITEVAPAMVFPNGKRPIRSSSVIT